jgi:hypothetical protein
MHPLAEIPVRYMPMGFSFCGNVFVLSQIYMGVWTSTSSIYYTSPFLLQWNTWHNTFKIIETLKHSGYVWSCCMVSLSCCPKHFKCLLYNFSNFHTPCQHAYAIYSVFLCKNKNKIWSRKFQPWLLFATCAFC